MDKEFNSLFKAINDHNRRKILDMLRASDMTAGEIADAFDMTKPSISHHLDILKKAGLVLDFKEGQFIRYSLNTSVLEDVLTWIMNLKDSNNT
ncbi:MAG: winged helix-turn-helix transcriptional regulator [Bacteroidetes bacterium]|nr:winged helix-turn-helix transcriptional regulator [Bacteroidota bacterium]MCB0843279.1 winged helix-turn-helix transcriptional regulator [Bacteroidota bacterium]